ncbi:MAG: esterase-like activity of phytase family protein [Rheinheimera sp.]
MKISILAASITLSLLLSACSLDGDNGKDGLNGKDGSNGSNGATGLNSLVKHTTLPLGHTECLLGGQQIDSGLDRNTNNQLETTEISQTSYLCTPHNFARSGERLPYTVLRSDLANGALPGSNMEIRNGGYGSDLTGHPTKPMHFYAITDRGPNADFTGSLGAGKMFPVPEYTPRIGLFEILPTGAIRQLQTILLKRPDGTPISGFPNPAGLGATNEIPYLADGSVARQDPNLPYDAVTNPTRLDPYGLDPEGLVALKDGSFWVSDEYGPHLVHYSAQGVEIGRINPFSTDSRNSYALPAEFAKRRANRGMEGLTVTPDEKYLVGIMQSAMGNPGSATHNSDLTRIVFVELATGAIKQYLYKQELKQNSNSAIVALSATSFLILERDGEFQEKKPGAMKHVYKIDLSKATDLEKVPTTTDLVQHATLGLTVGGLSLEQLVVSKGWDGLSAAGIVPASKTLVVDMVAQVNYPHDKMEGLWRIDEKRLGVINDDDFATWVNKNQLEQKYLDLSNSKVDGNTLYIIDKLDLKPTAQ